MASLFHQNMRTFGGASANRNAAFSNAFAAMNAGVGNDVVAAGFTEITNPSGPLRQQLLTLSAVIDSGLTDLVVCQVGTSALGLTEYIGMTWDDTHFPVTHAGMIVYNNLKRTWNTYVTAAAFPTVPVLTIPGGPFNAVDSRGPAFLAGQLGGGIGDCIVMFFHNMYNLGDRSSGFSGLQNCGQDVRAKLPNAYASAPIYIGGDFNVLPRDQRKRRTNLPMLDYRAARVGNLANNALINTTTSNCYDYWLLTNASSVPLANVAVFTQSRATLASDHAAIRARI